MLVRLTPLALAAAMLAGCAAPGLSPGPQNLAPAQFAQLPASNPGAATMTTAFADSAQESSPHGIVRKDCLDKACFDELDGIGLEFCSLAAADQLIGCKSSAGGFVFIER